MQRLSSFAQHSPFRVDNCLTVKIRSGHIRKGMPLRHPVLSQQSKFLIFYMHLIELYVTKHKNDELYFDPCLNLPV